MDEVLNDFKAVDENYLALVKKYADEMEEIVKSNGGSISDVPIGGNESYWHLQRKLHAAHRMHNEGQLVDKVIDEPLVEEVEEPIKKNEENQKQEEEDKWSNLK